MIITHVRVNEGLELRIPDSKSRASFHIMFFGQLHPALPFVLVLMLTIKSLIVHWHFPRAWYSGLMALPSIQWGKLTHDSQLANWHFKAALQNNEAQQERDTVATWETDTIIRLGGESASSKPRRAEREKGREEKQARFPSKNHALIAYSFASGT